VGDRPNQLALFLKYVENQEGELLILGDLFEFWQASLSKVVVNNRPLLDQLSQMNAVYILGNHDADLGAFIGSDLLIHPFFGGMRAKEERVIAGKKFRFMHGHEVDPFNSGDAPGWGRMLAIFAGIFEDKNGSPFLADGQPVEGALEGFGENLLRLWNWLVNKLKKSVSGGDSPNPKNELTPAQNPDRALEMLALYKDYRIKNDYDVIIAGHTHQPGRIGAWYFNSGSWAGIMNNFIRIEPSGEVKTFNWADGKPEEKDTILPDPQ
jgi:UDP-2,3-diacylglucosamine pyrophosphatase LpxH